MTKTMPTILILTMTVTTMAMAPMMMSKTMLMTTMLMVTTHAYQAQPKDLEVQHRAGGSLTILL
jgi:hypothetical protein